MQDSINREDFTAQWKWTAETDRYIGTGRCRKVTYDTWSCYLPGIWAWTGVRDVILGQVTRRYMMPSSTETRSLQYCVRPINRTVACEMTSVFHYEYWHGSVATHMRWGGIPDVRFTSNLLLSLPVKEFLKSINAWWSYDENLVANFWTIEPPCSV